MSFRDQSDFQEKLAILNSLMSLREGARTEIDQRYITIDSILSRLDVLEELGKLDGHRILAFGDGDLTALAIAIFGKPSEVVVADIDQRLSEIYFEASMEYDLSIRFLYHDMRIKIIEILLHQYSVILLEPPHTPAAIEVYLSRTIQCIEKDQLDGIFVSVPHSGSIREFFDEHLTKINARVKNGYEKLNVYEDGTPASDFVQIELTEESKPTVPKHWVRPFFEHEVAQKMDHYRCICRRSIHVGPGGDFETIEELERTGCSECGYIGIFAFHSKIKLV